MIIKLFFKTLRSLRNRIYKRLHITTTQTKLNIIAQQLRKHQEFLFFQMYKEENETIREAQIRFFKSLKCDSEKMKAHQNEATELLAIFTDICKKNKLTYFLIGGSMLGAVRHDGFIPWDDDLDVAMPADDYRKFIDVIKNSDYKIVDFVYISSCQRIFKFMFNDTNRHAFLDIFTYDLININENIGRKLRNKYIAKKIFFTAFNPRIRYMFKTGKKVLYDGSIRERDKISECYYSLLDKNYIRYRKKIFKKENSGYQKTIVYDINSCKSLIKPLIAYDRVFPLKAAKFNGVDVFIPNDYDFYLKSTYGDYYSLPISFNNHMGIS